MVIAEYFTSFNVDGDCISDVVEQRRKEDHNYRRPRAVDRKVVRLPPLEAHDLPATSEEPVTDVTPPTKTTDEAGGNRIALKVRGVVYPPTSIAIGHSRRTVDLEVEYAMFTESDGEVVMAPLA